ncbi:MAG: sigma-70 family RNA polymerase sigma factor [Armatimonadota bacterium]|nr:sigma-70 family RNA polymerase sigma factor [Armatimonadota bacterium]
MRQAELPDETLLRRAAQGNASAFDALMARHEDAVFHYLTRLVTDLSLAEDLAQECWLRVWRARHSYQPSAAFRTWLFTIARHLALDQAKAPRLPTAPLTETLPGSTDPCGQVIADALERAIDEALARLPMALREAVVLRDMEGMAYADIARITGCPLGTVKSRINAARIRLQAVAHAWLKEEDR